MGRREPLREEERVHPAGGVQILLEPAQRNERRAYRALARHQRKIADGVARHDRAHGQPQRLAEIILASVQRLDRDGGRLLDADDHAAAIAGADFRCKRGIQQHVPVRGPGTVDAVKLPEAIVHAIDLDTPGASARLLIGDHPLDGDQRRDADKCRAECRVAPHIVGERFEKELGR